MKSPVHVVCCGNSAFNMPMCVMLTSLVDNFDHGRKLVLHIISNDATDKDRSNVVESIKKIRPSLDLIEIQWYSVDASLLAELHIPTQSHFSRDVYARLFAPHLLPESCERAIYLDCDMVILADISKLSDSTASLPDLLHAVHDVAIPRVSSDQGVFDYAERGIPPETHYFNSGIMVIDLKRWRERNLTAEILDYLAKGGDRVRLVDQGALNAILFRDWAPLDSQWNQSTSVLFEELWADAGYTRNEWQRVKNDPYVVHYAGSHKPWGQPRRYYPRRIHFYRYLAKTVYKNTVPRYPYLESIMGPRAYYQLWIMASKMFPNGFRLRPEIRMQAA